MNGRAAWLLAISPARERSRRGDRSRENWLAVQRCSRPAIRPPLPSMQLTLSKVPQVPQVPGVPPWCLAARPA